MGIFAIPEFAIYISSMKKQIYLDYSATTPPAEEVIKAMQDVFVHTFGNPSSIHSYGRDARNLLEKARGQVASVLKAEPGEIYFTSGGTEANNWAVKGFAEEGKKKGKNHIITSLVEHDSVLTCCRYLASQGYEVSLLPVCKDGVVDPETLRNAIRPTTGLITLMHVNNEIGSITNIARIARIAVEAGVSFHSDAVQSLGKLPIDVGVHPVTAFSLSAHKIFGPKGLGALYVRKGCTLEPYIHGGGQERGRRAGTENVALAAGFGVAALLAEEIRAVECLRIQQLRQRLLKGLQASLDGIIVNSPLESSVPHILNISFDPLKSPLDGEVLLMNLDLEGIAISSGSACTSGSIEPSHVLLAMGRNEQTAKTALRFSLGRFTTEDDIDRAVVIVVNIVNKIRKSR